jgi:hypothetical protein
VQSRFVEKLGRSRVLVVADFRGGAPEVQIILGLGGRVMVAGIGTAVAKKELEARGVDVSGVARARAKVLELALDRLPGADAVVFGAGDWERERREMLEVEREEAAVDGRFPRVFIVAGDSRYDFLRSPEERAAYALARAAGADPESAKEFSSRQTSGHKDKDTHGGTRSGGRAKAPAKRQSR